MSELFDDLVSGLNEAIEIEKGSLQAKATTYVIEPVKMYSNDQIRKIRNNAGMTQSVFASYMGVSKKTVEAWEKGRNNPTGSACRLLNILDSKELEHLPFVTVQKG
jgi:putative transcriptional regulator